MKILGSLLCLTCSLMIAWTHSAEAKPKSKHKAARPKSSQASHPLLGNPNSKYRGWDYLAGQLRKAGVAQQDIDSIYQDPRMPRFTFIPFKVKPKEASTMYTSFNKDFFAQLGASFIDEYDYEFDSMERAYGVPREVVTAILVIETQIGRHTGNDIIVYRLSRLASVLDPNNLQENYRRLKASDPNVTLEEVKARGRYLEDTFLPEIPALLEISKRNHVNIFHVLGSSAGAFGIPQFLPTAFHKYGIDGDGDGFVSLFNKTDALWSAGNYLAAFGYRRDLPYAEKRKVIWEYNRSDAYIDTVLRLAARIREHGVMGCKRARLGTEANVVPVGWCPDSREP
jgi:membrane-bound lytic murein transglycosylase B